MSQMTATARPLRAPRRPAGVPLRVMPKGFTRTGNGAFASLCLVLLTLGLIALLLLNTALAQGSLDLGRLQKESAALQDDAANLRGETARAAASGTLAMSAIKLGMVRSNERAYIDLATGKVTGTAYPATSYQALSVVTRTTPPPPLTARDAALVAAAAKAAMTAVLAVAPPAPKPSAKPAAKPVTKAAKPATTPKKPATTPKKPASATPKSR